MIDLLTVRSDRLRSTVRKPMFALGLDQLLSSGGNAIALLLAAHWLSGKELSTYALMQFAVTTGIVLQRAVFIEPTVAGSEHLAGIPRRWLLTAAASALLVSPALVLTLANVALPVWMWPLAAAPLVQDALRYSWLAQHRTWRVAISDGLWAALVILLAAFVWHHNERSMFLAWTLGATLGLFVLLPGWRPARSASPLLPILRVGALRMLDTLVSMAPSLVGLPLAAQLAPYGTVGYIRTAQSLLGPLGVIHTTISTRLLTTANAIRSDKAEPVIRRLRGLQRIVVGSTAIYTLLAILGVSVAVWIGFLPRPLILALVIAGAAVLASSFASPWVAVVLPIERQGLALALSTSIACVAIASTIAVFEAGVSSWVVASVAVLTSGVLIGIAWPVVFQRIIRETLP